MNEIEKDQLALQEAYLDILSTSEKDVNKMGEMLHNFRENNESITERIHLDIQKNLATI